MTYAADWMQKYWQFKYSDKKTPQKTGNLKIVLGSSVTFTLAI